MVDSIKKDSKLYIGSAAIATDIADKAAGEAITWIEIGRVVSFPDFGVSENTVSQDYVNTDVSQAQKGFVKGSTSDIMLGFDPTDAGQVALRAAAAGRLNWPLKLESSDSSNPVTTTNTVRYARCLINKANFAGGGGEEFDNETFPVTLNQIPVVVYPEAII